jgi:hypothetical protein
MGMDRLTFRTILEWGWEKIEGGKGGLECIGASHFEKGMESPRPIRKKKGADPTTEDHPLHQFPAISNIRLRPS